MAVFRNGKPLEPDAPITTGMVKAARSVGVAIVDATDGYRLMSATKIIADKLSRSEVVEWIKQNARKG